MLTSLFKDFFNSEKTSGFLLIGCTVVSMALANSVVGDGYTGFWETQFNGHSITHWINDGLMAIFFLLVGLELEREIYVGELAGIKKAAFPAMAAFGGVLIPAIIFTALNYGTEFQAGSGIPMATDIAFAIGMLALLGSRVPANLKIFITALAVIDDLFAIIVIAVFYSDGVAWWYLATAGGLMLVMFVLNRLKVYNLIPYLILTVGLWYCMLNSGVHATIAGVLAAFAIPFGDGSEKSPSYILQHALHKPVAFIIVPIFALANTAIIFEPNWMDGFASTVSYGIIGGLVLGKPIGIMIFAYLAVAVGIASLPKGLKWKHILGTGMLAGIGFTMSIFVAILAFDNPAYVATAKIAIITASLISSLAGLIYLKIILKRKFKEEEEDNTEIELD
jgi:NhaA family Na+:H+ antiporter